MQPIPRTTFEQLAARYPVLLLDAYGVLVHSTGALPDAVARIAYLNRTGKPYFLLTNDASTLPAAAARRSRPPLPQLRAGHSGRTHHQLGGAAGTVLRGPWPA